MLFHHVGLLVDNIDTVSANYADLFGKSNVSTIQVILSQQVKVCFVKIAENSFIELVEPMSPDSKVYNLIKKKFTYYHMGYLVEDIIVEVDKLKKLNYKPLEFFNSEAFEGKKCIFLFSPDAHLIELIEM